jgi:hypothetical protein
MAIPESGVGRVMGYLLIVIGKEGGLAVANDE